jgi:hypothetical protein
MHQLRGILFTAIYTRDETRFGAHLSVNVSQEKDQPASHTNRSSMDVPKHYTFNYDQ